ncbi:helix-turn-helix domain-containing protein [Bifidobacterium vansinderenii]|uniref:Helix-turn-helix domain-containing protein n=1 Tax=Bifidobacterium vansinderenii TaxID=1984871 RepID=A0A229VWK9_9BIFI|nr:helix-turn-helix domain-containing protein [Bifidobacterium vansinderenii]OXM99915.1 hypothetical protein Tam10B_1878 [Bifidobacterium vansinderenii]
MSQPMEPLAVKRPEAARLLSVSVETLDSLIRSGSIRARQQRGSRTILISVQSIHEYLGDVKPQRGGRR